METPDSGRIESVESEIPSSIQVELPQLGTCTQSPQVGTPTGLVGFLRPLKPDEFQAFHDASIALGRFRQKRQLFEVVLENHRSFHNLFHELTLELGNDNAVSFERANRMVVRLNTSLLNFLSSVRTFLDHAETWLKRECGDPSSELTAFKAAASKEFDGNVSYRFLSQLRNFTQHCGMPLGELKFNASMNVCNPDAPHQIVLDGFFSRDYLLNNFGGWKMVKADLEQMPPIFPVTPHVDEMVGCLQRIEDILLGIQANGLEHEIKVLESLAEEVSHMAGSPCVYTEFSQGADSFNANLIRIHQDQIENTKSMIKSLETPYPDVRA